MDEFNEYFRLPGRKAQEDLSEPSLFVKEGSANDEIQLCDDPADDALGFVPGSKKSGQFADVLPRGVGMFFVDGGVSKGDPLALTGTSNKHGYVQQYTDQAHTFVGYATQAASDGEEVLAIVDVFATGPVRQLSITTGSEGDQTADAFDVDLDQNLPHDDDWLVEVYDNNMDPSSNIQITSQGSGSLQTAADQDSAIARLHTDGTETLRFLDSSGTLSATVHVVCTPLDSEGEVREFDLPYS